jgi:Carboxypeptidase regulatory-like domain/S-layer homology domain
MNWSRSLKFLAALSVAAGLAAPPEARAADTPIRHPAQVMSPVRMDTSPALRTITPIKVVPDGQKAPENPPIPKQGRTLGNGPAGADAALQAKPGSTNMPAPIVNFEGVNNINGVLPPDTQGDVGPNHFIQWVNLSFSIYDKTGTTLYGPAAGTTLWSGFGGACETSNGGDPQTNYDHLADRWVMSQLAYPSTFHQCIAISATPDPLGPWYRYDYLYGGTGTTLNDYPKFGVWPDGYYMTANQFVGGTTWGGLGVVVYERDQMLVGGVARQIYFNTGLVTLNYGGALPADLDGPPPAAGTPGYVVEWDMVGWIPGDTANTLRIWQVHADWANPAASTFGLNANYDPNFKLDTAAGTVLPCVLTGSRNCIPQPGTAQKLDSLGDRLMQRLQYRNIGGVGKLTVNHTLDAGSGRAGVRWYQLTNPGAGWTMADQGTFAGNPGDTENRWMGAAALDIQGNMAVGYSVSSSTTYPSIRYNGRLAGDPAGTLGAEATLIAGGGSQLHSAARWGDYSALLVDPTDECTFWYTTEYLTTTGSAPWQTRIGSFKFPNCVAGPSGVIEGYVKSTAGGGAIPGAHVQVGPSYSTTTNASGFYQVTVPVGTYDVTASKFGYTPATAPGQVVTDGGTTIVPDLLLTPTGSYTVDGFVTAAEHLWPLWAKIEIRQAATLINTLYTSPWNGYYEVLLPNGYTYEFTVQSMYQGYLSEVRSVTLTSGDQVQNFTLLPASGNPAYSCYLDGGVNENFNAAFPPLGWTVINNASNPGNIWKRNDQWGRANLTGGTGFAAAADSDKAGSGSGLFNTELWSPSIKMPATPRNLKFRSAYQSYSGETGTLDVSTTGGATWTNLLTITVTAVAERTVNMTAYANQMIVLRWKFISGDWAYYWQIDDVRTETIPAPPPPPVSQWVQNWDGVVAPALPADWTKATVTGTPVWSVVTALTFPTAAPHTPLNLLMFNSFSASSGTARMMRSTGDNLSTGTGYLRFWMYHDTGYAGSADSVRAQVSTDSGTTWQSVGTAVNRYDGSTGWKQHEVTLTGFSGPNTAVRVGLLGTTAYGNNIGVDEVELLIGAAATPPVADNPILFCSPVAGSMVAGFVTDANTAAGLTGAKVVRDLGGIAFTMAATGNLPAGFYYMFSADVVPPPPPLGPSTRTFTASKTGYGSVAHSVNLIPNTTNRLDFALPAGSLTLGGWPFNLDGRLTPDGQPTWDKTQAWSILNSGGLPANVKLTLNALGPGWTPPRMWPAFVPEPASPTPTKKSIGRAPNAPVLSNAKRYPGLAGPLTAIPAFGMDLVTSAFVTWPDASVPGTWTVIANEPGSAYFGGDFLNGDFTKLWVVDYSLNQLHTLNTVTGAKTVIGSMTPNAGESWTGLKGSSDGNVYASATTCASSTLYTVDPATGHATAIGPITNGACVIDIAINNAGEIYGVDIVSDNLLKINPATGAGTVVGPLGINANYAQGMSFEKDSGILYWAAYSTSGELRTIDTATGASFLVGPFPGGAEVDAFAIASGGATGLPWVTNTPTEGVAPAHGQLDILTEFFPEGVPAANFGLFRAEVHSTNDTPMALPTIPVFFTKAYWDVPRGSFADAFIHGLAGARVTRSCGGGNYCPNNTITRAEMAVTMVRGTHGPDFTPPPAIGIFADVVISDTDTTADYIEQLYNDGVVAGCATGPPRLYCPNALVNRAQMAIFVGRGLLIPPVSPPTHWFTDFAGSGWEFAEGYAEALYNHGITAGCGSHLFCPLTNITRAQLAVWLVIGLGIPHYTHPAGP